MTTAPPQYDVVIVGAGVAGLAAASALSSSGAHIALVERRPFVAGRAYSYLHPALDEVVDSQHILVGCCTNLRHLLAQASTADRIRWYDRYTFLEPGGRRSDLAITALPAPFHTTPSFLAAPMLSLADKLRIAAALRPFLRGYSTQDDESVAHWLQRTRQPQRTIDHFYLPVLFSALNDTLDRCSMRYAGQVFYRAFLASAEGARFGVPTVPLSDLFGNIAGHCAAQGTSLLYKTSVASLQKQSSGWAIAVDDSTHLETKAVILATSFEHTPTLLGPGLTAQVLPQGTGAFTHSPITTIQLWYDQPFTDLDHAVLLDTGLQWLFHKSRIRNWPVDRGSYLELTISASHEQLHQSREAILERSLAELEDFFPEARKQKPSKAGILKEAKATFSVTPGLDRLRPSQKTAVPGLFLAGDWTDTGWPSTMEGAVRSGYLAAEAAAEHLGTPHQYLQPELPPAGLMRLLARQ